MARHWGERQIAIEDSTNLLRRPERQHMHCVELGAMHVRGVQTEHKLLVHIWRLSQKNLLWPQRSGGVIAGGARWAAAPPDSHFVKYGAPVQQVVNI